MKRVIQYLHDNYGVDTNTSTTILVTLLIFIVGYLITSIASLLKLWWKRKSYRKGMFVMLHSFQKSCMVQGRILTKSLRRFGIEEGKSIRIDYATISSLEHLNKVDLGEFLANFLSLNNRSVISKTVTRIVGIIHHIKHLNDQLLEERTTYSPLFEKYQDEYYDSLGAIRKIHDELLSKFARGQISDESAKSFFKGLNNIFLELAGKQSASEIYRNYDNLITPLRALCKQYFQLDDAQVLANLALKADYAFQNLKEITKLLLCKYSSTAIQHLNSARTLKLYISILESQWFCINIWSKRPPKLPKIEFEMIRDLKSHCS